MMPERAEFRIDRQVIEYYEWRLDRITLPDGRYGLVCYFRDISAQVHARVIADSERELREADRRKDEFLALLAHELRNPLAPIRTGLELIRSRAIARDRPPDAGDDGAPGRAHGAARSTTCSTCRGSRQARSCCSACRRRSTELVRARSTRSGPRSRRRASP